MSRIELNMPESAGWSEERSRLTEARLANDGHYDGLPLDLRPAEPINTARLVEAIKRFDPSGEKARRATRYFKYRDGTKSDGSFEPPTE